MDLEAFAWLLTEPGQRLLARASELDDSLASQTALRKDFPGEYVALAVSQVALRRKAVPMPRK